MNQDKILSILKALSEKKRFEILKILSESEKEMCACEILDKFNITQPTLSHDMKILIETEIVESRKDGKWTYYKINKSNLNLFFEQFQKEINK